MLVYRDVRGTVVQIVVRLDQHVCLDTCLNWQRESRHGFRLMDLQLNSVDTRRQTGEHVIWCEKRMSLGPRWLSRVCWFLSRVVRVWK